MKDSPGQEASKRWPCYCFIPFILLVILEPPADTLAYERFIKTGNLTVSATRTELFTLTTPDNISGDIGVETWAQDRVEVDYDLVAKARSEKEAQRFTEMVELTLDRNGRNVRLQVKTPSRAPWRGDDRSLRLDLKIRLPKEMEIESRSIYFDLDLDGPFKNVKIDNDYGSVSLRQARGDISVRTSYSEIVLEQIEGQLRAESSYGGLSLTDVEVRGKGAILESSYGEINMRNVKGQIRASTSYGGISAFQVDAGDSPISLKTTYGEIELENVKGQLSAETSYERITGSNITLTGGSSRLATVYSRIRADFAAIKASRLSISNKYSDIELTLPSNTSAVMAATVDPGGSIHARNFPLTPTLLDRTRLEGIAGGGESAIEMNIDGIGTIEIIGK